MAISSSFPVTFSSVRTEFGEDANPSLRDYYAGGGLVQSGATGVDGPIPSSGTILLSAFRGSYAYLYDGTITPSSVLSGNLSNPSGSYITYAYNSGLSAAAAGSASPSTFQGHSFELSTAWTGGSYGAAYTTKVSYFRVNYGSNPGYDAFSSITCEGVTFNNPGSSYYTYTQIPYSGLYCAVWQFNNSGILNWVSAGAARSLLVQ